MSSAREYCHVSQHEFEEAIGLEDGQLIEGLAFVPVRVKGCRELVYEAVVNDRFSVRIFSSIVMNHGARDVGKDAIRVVKLFWDNNGKSFPIGKEKRVNRIQTWRNNLLLRIESVLAEELVCCPACGRPMKERRGVYGAFWGCLRYPRCIGKRRIEE